MPSDPHNDAAEAARRLLGRAPDAVERIRGGGRNSSVWRIRADGRHYALKRYPPRRDGERDRAAIEYSALRFLTAHGIATVPQPVASDSRLGATLLEWIEGESVPEPSAADIAAAAAFIAAVHALRGGSGAGVLPPAAEACLSGAEIVRQIESRLACLSRQQAGEPALAAFLAGSFEPLLSAIAGWAAAGYGAAGLDFDRPLALAARTLCPADFGFHNVIRRKSGVLAFLDFDYFGWDDPVKLVSDFVLHPGMSLGDSLKRQFAAAAAVIYRDDRSFRRRLALLYPLFGLRWCAILLNEFLPERWAQRVNAGIEADWTAAKRHQLDRAREWAQSFAATFRQFPYGE